jgi:RNA polymerase-binding transcription factor DksA
MLSPEVSTQLESMLQGLRADLMEHMRTHADPPDEGQAPEIGPAAHMAQHDDAPEAEMISHDEARMVSRDDAELAAIDRQLGRLELGEADVCIVCGELIPPERLLANPLADTCIKDQRDIEQRAHLANPDAEPTM